MNVSQIKDAVRKRDGYRCTNCGKTDAQHVLETGKALEVHRLQPGSPYTLAGCVTLCKTCHGPQPKRPRGTAAAAGRGVVLRLAPDLDSAFAAYLASRRPRVSQNAALECALRLFLKAVEMLDPYLASFLASRTRAPNVTDCVETALEDFLRAAGYWPPPEPQPREG